MTDHEDGAAFTDLLQPGQEPLKPLPETNPVREALSSGHPSPGRHCWKKSFSDNIKHLPLPSVILPHIQLDLLSDEGIDLAGGSDALTEVRSLTHGPDLDDLRLAPLQVIEDQLDVSHCL